MEQTIQKRPGGRTQRNSDAVARAVMEILGENRLDFTFQEVADRSNVSIRTLHRRWPDRMALIAAALQQYNSVMLVETTDDLRSDLFQFMRRYRDRLQHPPESTINRLSAAAPGVEFARLLERGWQPVRTALRDRLEVSQAKGEFAHEIEPDIIIDMLVGPVGGLHIVMRQLVEDSYLDRLVTHALLAVGYREAIGPKDDGSAD